MWFERSCIDKLFQHFIQDFQVQNDQPALIKASTTKRPGMKNLHKEIYLILTRIN